MKKILYIIDDINYESGARKVTEYQMKLLSDKFDISVFCLRRPSDNIVKNLPFVKFIGDEIWSNTEILAISMFDAIKLKRFNYRQKLSRIIYSISMRMHLDQKNFNNYIDEKMKSLFNQFDTVIVVSESSKLRVLVSTLNHPNKIQWIHTDYALWSEFSDWTKKISSNDGVIYKKFDKIVVLSEKCKKGFIGRYPFLKEKVIIIPNLINTENIKLKGLEPINIKLNNTVTNIVSVGRIDREKAYDRVVRICRKLKDDNIKFHWYIIGDGPLTTFLDADIKKYNLLDEVRILGRMDNPYPIMKSCDLFALLSEYEGLPVTIQEALILGTPIIATDVGGISELINDDFGVLVDNNEYNIYNDLKNLLMNKELLTNYKSNIALYNFDNETTVNLLTNIL